MSKKHRILSIDERGVYLYGSYDMENNKIVVLNYLSKLIRDDKTKLDNPEIINTVKKDMMLLLVTGNHFARYVLDELIVNEENHVYEIMHKLIERIGDKTNETDSSIE